MISKCTEELEKNPALLEKAKRAQDVTSDGLLSPNSVKTIWVSYVDGKRTSLLPVLCMPGASVLCTFFDGRNPVRALSALSPGCRIHRSCQYFGASGFRT